MFFFNNKAGNYLHGLIFIILFVAARMLKKTIREVSERSKEHAWKACIPLKGIEGSNPFLSTDFSKKQWKIAFIKWDKDSNYNKKFVFIHSNSAISI